MKTSPYYSEDILAVVVIYNISLRSSSSMTSLNQSLAGLKALMDVVVYDNSPQAVTGTETGFSNLNILYHHNPNNPGVSAAYNFGAGIAVQKGKQWLLLLDQDTTLPQDFIGKCLAGLNQFSGDALFAPRLMSNGQLFSPCKYFLKRGSHFPVNALTPGPNQLKGVTFLNSGLLLKLDLYQKVNGYDEAIRLYFSDFDFIDKLRREINGYILLDTVCEHELSSNESGDKRKASFRFRIYCRDGRHAAKDLLSWCMLLLTIGLRALKLSLHFKDALFLGIFLRFFLLSND